jgi:hypothetical protein
VQIQIIIFSKHIRNNLSDLHDSRGQTNFTCRAR